MMTETMKEAAGPGRAGRMPRQRKAVLRLLRGEDLERVSPSLSMTAALPSDWRDAFLAAGEASLATRPCTGEVLETERLRAGSERCFWKGNCWRPRLPCWRAAGL
jgi:hypothetical protein